MRLLRQIEGGAEAIGSGGGPACVPGVHRSLDERGQIRGEDLLARLEQTPRVANRIGVAFPHQLSLIHI